MRPNLGKFACSFLLLLLVTAGWLSGGEQTKHALKIDADAQAGTPQHELKYLLALPADYEKQADARWPLVLFLHGGGERGDDLEKVKVHGPPRLAAAGKDLPYVLVSPQCPTGVRWNPHDLAKLVEAVANTHRVDRRRLYVTGLSMGGGGTWSLLTEYPGRFAAAVPICGRGDLAAVEKLAKTPIRVFVGGKDREQIVQSCQEMTAALRKAGGDAELKLYPDLPHDCWTVTYDDPAVWEWLLAQRLPQAD